MKVKDFIQNINWECSTLERVAVDTGTERIELPGEVLRRPASEVWRREFIEALNMTVREARVISVDTMVIFAVGGEGGENMNELKEMLMEQLQLLHEHSKHGCCIPGELVDLSNAMANIAEVVVQIDDDMDSTGTVACAGITADKLTGGGKISQAGAMISPTPDDPARIESILRQQPPSTNPRGLLPDDDYAKLREP